MVDGERGLEPVFRSVVEVGELRPRVEYERVDLRGAESLFDCLGERPHAGQPAQIERQHLDRPGTRRARTEQQPRVRWGDDSLRGDQPQAGCAARHDDCRHAVCPSRPSEAATVPMPGKRRRPAPFSP
jgi:hypothetical protein